MGTPARRPAIHSIPDLRNSFLTLQIQAVTALAPGVEGDELVGGLVAGDELGGGGDGGCAVGGGVGVAAVVEDDVGGLALAVQTVDFVSEAAGNGVG